MYRLDDNAILKISANFGTEEDWLSYGLAHKANDLTKKSLLFYSKSHLSCSSLLHFTIPPALFLFRQKVVSTLRCSNF